MRTLEATGFNSFSGGRSPNKAKSNVQTSNVARSCQTSCLRSTLHFYNKLHDLIIAHSRPLVNQRPRCVNISMAMMRARQLG
jgi:hypothetical protein